jgi:hypothetical protein
LLLLALPIGDHEASDVRRPKQDLALLSPAIEHGPDGQDLLLTFGEQDLEEKRRSRGP